MSMTVKTDHNVVDCAVGWDAVPMQRLCAGGHVDHTRQPSTTANRSWRREDGHTCDVPCMLHNRLWACRS